jgi:hypothetical protein
MLHHANIDTKGLRRNNRFVFFKDVVVQASVSTSVLLLEFLDAVPLIGLNLTEYGASPIEDEMRNGHKKWILGVRSADIQTASDPAFVSRIKDLRHSAPVWQNSPRYLSQHHSFESWWQPGC